MTKTIADHILRKLPEAKAIVAGVFYIHPSISNNDAINKLQTIGYIEPSNKRDAKQYVRSPVKGLLVLNFPDGSNVEAGDVVANINPPSTEY